MNDIFPGDGFQGDIDYLNSQINAGEPPEIKLLKALSSLAGGYGTAQLAASTPAMAKGAYGVLKGLGNEGKIALGASPEAQAMMKGLATPEEMAEVNVVLQGGVKAYIKGYQKGLNGEQIPIYGVKGPASKLKELFGDAEPGSVPENVLIEKGLLPGVAQKSISSDIAAQKTLNLTEDTGGATFNLQKGSLAGTPHYAVSIYPERELVLKGELTTKQIEAYIAKNKDLLDDPMNSLGIWNDAESGKTYLDVTVTTPDKVAAMKLASDNGQKAIFDLGKMEEIRIGKGK